jgi:hypothetical protein
MSTTGEMTAREGERPAADLGSCKDSFRYKVVEDGGRYRFASVRAVSGTPCEGEVLAGLLAYLDGAWLDEVSPEQIEGFVCRHDGGCSRALAEMVRELKQLLLQ